MLRTAAVVALAAALLVGIAIPLLIHPETVELTAREEQAPTPSPQATVGEPAAPPTPAQAALPNPPVTPPIGPAVGQPQWTLSAHRGTIAGFTDKDSVADGESFSLFVTTPAASFGVEVFRLGWYANGSEEAQLVQDVRGLPGIVQPAPLVDSQTGLISASNWTSNGRLTVSGWRTGLYVLKLIAADGDQSYIPLVVRDDVGTHDFLFEHAAATDQAYNAWGGKSLYDFNSTGAQTASGTARAVKVSFDRPYDEGGSGNILKWELNMVRFLESKGYDVSYVSDLDVHRNASFAAHARAVIQAGHDEYWSKEMRDHLESVRDAGKGLGFFSGDTGAWAVRFEDSPLGKDRVEVYYRTADKDPVAATDPSHATVHWWEPPLSRPTQAFFGVGSNGPVRWSGDWVAEGVDKAPALFANTGFKNGDVVPNLVGYEYDGLWTDGAGSALPGGLTVLGKAQVIPQSRPEALLNFAVSRELQPGAQPAPGRISATVETLPENPNWDLLVHLASGGKHYDLEYVEGPASDPPRVYPRADGGRAAHISMGEDFYAPGWRPFARDLAADFANAFQEPSDRAVITSLVLSGSLALGPLTLTSPGGSVVSLDAVANGRPEAAGWRVTAGEGELGTTKVGDTDQAALLMRAAIPGGRRADEADTVAMRTRAGGLVVAVGTIQWSWALDGYGNHVDARGAETKVDSRVQALTQNMLQALKGG